MMYTFEIVLEPIRVGGGDFEIVQRPKSFTWKRKKDPFISFEH